MVDYCNTCRRTCCLYRGEQWGQVSISPNKEERLKIDNYEEVIISSHHRNGSCIDIRHVMGVNSSKEDTPKTNVALSWLSETRR